LFLKKGKRKTTSTLRTMKLSAVATLIFLSGNQHVALGLSQSSPTSPTIRDDIPIHKVPFRQSPSSPYCYAVSSIVNLPSSSNFLATQVWPSARVAARAMQDYVELILPQEPSQPHQQQQTFTIAELGCGPGLPTIVSASTLSKHQLLYKVIATDIDQLALDLVSKAAKEQNLEIATRTYDLIEASYEEEWMDDVDLFVMSDVFESEAIAKGAAKLTSTVLLSSKRTNTHIWVFAQSDRAQREIFMKEIQRQHGINGWSSYDSFHPNDRLWCCDLDETRVDYG
jgi:hypothetical protein